MTEPVPYDVRFGLKPARRHVGFARLASGLQRGLTVGALGGIVLLLSAHLLRSPFVVIESIGLLVASGAAGFAWGLTRWPGMVDVARIVDRRFGLDDRVTTALELQASRAPLAVLQRADVAARVGTVKLQDSRRGEVASRESVLAIACLAAFGALCLLPAPAGQASTSPASNAEDNSRIHQAAVVGVPNIARLLQRTSSGTGQRDPVLLKIDRQLALLRHRLLQTRGRAAALRSISLTQLQLQLASAKQPTVKSGAVSKLNAVLGQSLSQQQYSGRKAGSDPKLTARALNRLSASLSRLSTAQQRRIANGLTKASNSLGDRRLQATLRQAAGALGYHDPPTASRALQRAASFLSSSPVTRISQQRLKAANRELEKLKRSISQVRRGANPPQAGARPRNASESSGRSSSSKSGSRRLSSQRRTRGGAQGSGVTGSPSFRRNSGPPTGLAPGDSAATGHVSGVQFKRNSQASNTLESPTAKDKRRGHGKVATVFVPGAQGAGPHAVQNLHTRGLQRGAIIPYRQIFVRYSRTAHTALDRATLPPALRSYVRQYFDQLAR